MDKKFTFTVDDNIRFLQDLTLTKYESIFDNPYLAVYKKLHQKFNVKVKLYLFYKMEGFDLSIMTDRYKDEWQKNSNWLKLSFHSEYENENPYINSGYEEVFSHCKAVQKEILRFAGECVLGKTTTIHYCITTEDGNRAILDNGIRGVLGLFGTEEEPCISYNLDEDKAKLARLGKTVNHNGLMVAGIDIVLNDYSLESIKNQLKNLSDRPLVKVMIHEQYFYPYYWRYIPYFYDILATILQELVNYGYAPVFFEETL